MAKPPPVANQAIGYRGAVIDPKTVVVEATAANTERSPADVLRLVVATVALLVEIIVQWLFGGTLVAFMSELLSGLEALPEWIESVVVVGTRLLAVVFLGGGLVVTVLRGRWRLLVTVLLAVVLAVALASILDGVDPGPGETVVEVQDVAGPLTDPGFPSVVGVAVVSAVLTAAAPWLERRWRRLGWLLLVGVSVTRFLASPVSFESLHNLLVGWFSGAAVLVALGGPVRRPTGASIAGGLAAVGLPLARLEQASVDARGSSPYFGTAPDGQHLFVKALGEDQRSADLLFRIYRWAQRRDLGDERPFSTLRRGVEHEALVALAARELGVRTPRLAGFATADPNGYVLAYEAIEGRSLDRLEPAEMTDDVLAAIWEQVALMRRHRIAHRDLRLANVFLAADGAVWMIDFGFSELAASDLLLTNDIAELLASSTLQVGAARAVVAGRTAVGADVLGDALDRLQPWALSGATRTGMKEKPGLLDELRREVQAVVAG